MLTLTLREAFVRAAMHDVPEIDYRAQAQKIVTEAAIAMMPELVKKAYDKHPECFALAPHYISGWGSFYLPKPDGVSFPHDVEMQLRTLHKASEKQGRERYELKNKLMSVALGCTTRKSLLAALPEFEKYLPAEEAPISRNVPALANVVTDFIKAGWPKDVQADLKIVKTPAL